jgi:esterase/lipase
LIFLLYVTIHLSLGGPIVIHLPGTGDEGFGFRRKLLATPLARDHQVTSIILQIPFYGKRRLSSQPSSALPYVEYMLSQSTGVVMEAIALIRYLREQKQYHGKLGLTGISFGGSMSALAGILCPHSIDIITNVPANSPNDAYVEGIMQHSIDWTLFPKRKESVSTLLTIMNIGGLVETTKASRSYDHLTNIRKSYYQLTAKHDKYIPWKNSLYLYENMKNLQYCHHAELILIPGGHVSSIVVYKQQYLETILKALRNNT